MANQSWPPRASSPPPGDLGSLSARSWTQGGEGAVAPVELVRRSWDGSRSGMVDEDRGSHAPFCSPLAPPEAVRAAPTWIRLAPAGGFSVGLPRAKRAMPHTDAAPRGPVPAPREPVPPQGSYPPQAVASSSTGTLGRLGRQSRPGDLASSTFEALDLDG